MRNKSSLREDLVEEAQNLRYVQLHVLQVKQVLIVLLLHSNVTSATGPMTCDWKPAYLLQKIVDIQVHLQDSLLATLVMKRDDERARRR